MKPPPKRDHIHKTINFNKNIHEAPKSNRWIDIKTVISVGIPAAIAILGWYYADKYSAQRDRDNKLRDMKLSYLIHAYSTLNNASISFHEGDLKVIGQIDTASTLINLFGSEDEIKAINIAIDEYTNNHNLMLDHVINLIRSNLRAELNIEKTESSIRHMGITDSAKAREWIVKDTVDSSQ